MGAASFINSVNTDYEALHKSFEEQFWGTKMALSDERFSVPELTRTKGEMEAFLADEQKLKTTREHLANTSELSEAEQKTLALFERTFQCYIMESAEAKELRATATRIEGALEAARNKMRLGATIDGSFVELSSVGLRSRMRVDPREEVRRACWDGLTLTLTLTITLTITLTLTLTLRSRCAGHAGTACAPSETSSSPTASSSS